jgi:hypothetical protein
MGQVERVAVGCEQKKKKKNKKAKSECGNGHLTG